MPLLADRRLLRLVFAGELAALQVEFAEADGPRCRRLRGRLARPFGRRTRRACVGWRFRLGELQPADAAVGLAQRLGAWRRDGDAIERHAALGEIDLAAVEPRLSNVERCAATGRAAQRDARGAHRRSSRVSARPSPPCSNATLPLLETLPASVPCRNRSMMRLAARRSNAFASKPTCPASGRQAHAAFGGQALELGCARAGAQLRRLGGGGRQAVGRDADVRQVDREAAERVVAQVHAARSRVRPGAR